MTTSFKQGRYSIYLRPMSYVVDLVIINSLGWLFLFKTGEAIGLLILLSIGWLISSVYIRFYDVYRFTRPVKILALLVHQGVLFLLLSFSLLGFYRELNIANSRVLSYVFLSLAVIAIVKFSIYYVLRKYRLSFGGNYRRTVIFGLNPKTRSLEEFFKTRKEYGYHHIQTFDFADSKIDLEYCFDFVLNEDIDELYCSVSEFSNEEMIELVDFADNNLKILKFIPDNKEIYTKKLQYEYYDYIPILSLRTIPLDDSLNWLTKRIFDILFSLFVVVFILSWLTPIVGLLIVLESKGPIFFKQSRNGFNYKEFDCYKFRSMTPNRDANLNQATRGDHRITKVGAFLRKTSIDELPQFFNVLFGDMSVVGPRPHMVRHTDMYAKRIDKFMVRHFVRPGITGLAQTRGYRGEVETDRDIIGRVRHDIFYIENWSLLFDVKIIFQTFINAIKGEEKAY